MPIMDTCTYCGREYYLMAIWWKGDDKTVTSVTVCNEKKCREQAKAAGFKRL